MESPEMKGVKSNVSITEFAGDRKKKILSSFEDIIVNKVSGGTGEVKFTKDGFIANLDVWCAIWLVSLRSPQSSTLGRWSFA